MARNSWTYHAPSAAQRDEIERVRTAYRGLNDVLLTLPDGRERSLAVTELEYSFARAERAILLHEPDELKAGR